MIGELMVKAIDEGVQLSGWIYKGEKIHFPVFTLPDGSVIVITDVDHYANLSDLIDSLYTPDGYNYQPWPGPDPSQTEPARRNRMALITGSLVVDATNFVECPQCKALPEQRCKTPTRTIHISRFMEYRNRYPEAYKKSRQLSAKEEQ